MCVRVYISVFSRSIGSYNTKPRTFGVYNILFPASQGSLDFDGSGPVSWWTDAVQVE